jgi:hypothetical protein
MVASTVPGSWSKPSSSSSCSSSSSSGLAIFLKGFALNRYGGGLGDMIETEHCEASIIPSFYLGSRVNRSFNSVKCFKSISRLKLSQFFFILIIIIIIDLKP